MGPARERHHVMLTIGVERNVTHQDKFIIVAHVAERAIEYIHGALAIAAIEFLERGDDALRSVEQAFPCGVVADIGKQRAHRGLGLVARGARHDRVEGIANVGRQRCYGRFLEGSVHDDRSVRPEPWQSPGGVTVASSRCCRQVVGDGRRILKRTFFLTYMKTGRGGTSASYPTIRRLYSGSRPGHNAPGRAGSHVPCSTRFTTAEFWNWLEIFQGSAACRTRTQPPLPIPGCAVRPSPSISEWMERR